MHEIRPLDQIRSSNTSFNYHRKCPQMWAYDQARRLEPIHGEVSAPLDFGNWWHAIRAAEAIEIGRERGTLRYAPPSLKTAIEGHEIPTDDEDLVATVWHEINQWWKAMSAGHKDLWVEELGDTGPDRLRYVDARWHEQYDKVIPFEDPVAVEMPWTRNLPKLKIGDETLEPQVPMSGVLDMLYFDRKRNLLVMRDAKSHKALGKFNQVDEMLDSQLQVYAWAAGPLVKEWGHGPIRAIQYDRVRMTAPKSPEVTLSGNLSKGVSDFDAYTYRTWAMTDTRPSDDELAEMAEEKFPDDVEARTRFIVTVDEILDRPGRVWGKVGEFYVTGAKKGQPKFGIYQPEEKPLLELSTPDAVQSWFRRSLTPLNRNIVATHLRSSVETSVAIEVTHRRLEVTGDAPRNFGQACRWCPFAALCKAELVGGVDGEYDMESMGLRVVPGTFGKKA